MLEKGKLIVFNGPSGSGKTTGASIAKKYLEDSTELWVDCFKISDELKNSVHYDLGIKDVFPDYFDYCKDEPNEFFLGKTPRDAYIQKATFTRKYYGDDFYVNQFIARAKERFYYDGIDIIIESCCGFDIEILKMAEAFGPENILLFKIDTSDREINYSDNRSYVSHKDVKPVWLNNNSDLASYENTLKNGLREWISSLQTGQPGITV